MTLKNKSIFLVLVLAFWVGAIGSGWPCESAGPNTHIGMITAIDPHEKTFTLRDAETQHLMTFEATDTILKSLHISNQVRVNYKDENGKRIAVNVHG